MLGVLLIHVINKDKDINFLLAPPLPKNVKYHSISLIILILKNIWLGSLIIEFILNQLKKSHILIHHTNRSHHPFHHFTYPNSHPSSKLNILICYLMILKFLLIILCIVYYKCASYLLISLQMLIFLYLDNINSLPFLNYIATSFDVFMSSLLNFLLNASSQPKHQHLELNITIFPIFSLTK